MTDKHNIKRYYTGCVYRVLCAAFGLFLVVVGIYVMFFGVVDPLICIAMGLGIAVIGANTLWAAIQAKASWLFKLGPFI